MNRENRMHTLVVVSLVIKDEEMDNKKKKKLETKDGTNLWKMFAT